MSGLPAMFLDWRSDPYFDDYDLDGCIRENQDSFAGFPFDQVSHVAAVSEGSNDGDDWRWVIALRDGRGVLIQGWCDYTGWDCQSNAVWFAAPTPEDAARRAAVGSSDREHEFDGNPVVAEKLLQQLAGGRKSETWREATDRELGVTSGRQVS